LLVYTENRNVFLALLSDGCLGLAEQVIGVGVGN